jgi:uncharacterized membrane protein HdeD (DUF308 family)
MDRFTYFFGSKSNGAHWLLLHGLVKQLLGSMIWRRWPLSSLWAVGMLEGVSILLSGSPAFFLRWPYVNKREGVALSRLHSTVAIGLGQSSGT